MVANKKILGMVGFAGSNEILGGGPVLDAGHLAFVSGSATLDTLATGAKGQKPITYFFRVVPQNAQQARTGVPYIVNALKLKKGDKVMVVDDGEAYGIGLASDAAKLFAARASRSRRQSVKETDQNPGGAAGFAADIQPVALQAVRGRLQARLRADAGRVRLADVRPGPEDRRLPRRVHGHGRERQPLAVQLPGRVPLVLRPEHHERSRSRSGRPTRKTYGAKSANDPFGAPSFVATQMLGDRDLAGVHGRPREAPGEHQRSPGVGRQAKLTKVAVPTTILGYSMAFNNPADALSRPEGGRDGVPHPAQRLVQAGLPGEVAPATSS